MVPRPMMYLALTYDHRLIDGREAVTFLKVAPVVRRGAHTTCEPALPTVVPPRQKKKIGSCVVRCAPLGGSLHSRAPAGAQPDRRFYPLSPAFAPALLCRDPPTPLSAPPERGEQDRGPRPPPPRCLKPRVPRPQDLLWGWCCQETPPKCKGPYVWIGKLNPLHPTSLKPDSGRYPAGSRKPPCGIPKKITAQYTTTRTQRELRLHSTKKHAHNGSYELAN